MYYRLIWTLPKDALAVVRAYPPLVVCFAGALAGTALVFDVFYLVASPGLALALVYTVPVLAGLIAGLVAAADDVGLERRVLVWTVAATVAIGITNTLVVAMVAAMRRTGPSDWEAGGQAVLFAACSLLAIALSVVVVGNLVAALGIEVQSRWPRKPVPAPVAAPAVAVRAGKPRVSKEAAARTPEPEPDGPFGDPYYEPLEPVAAYVPRVVDLDEPRPVTPAEGTGHTDRRVGRRRTAPSVPPSRRAPRPGRRPDR